GTPRGRYSCTTTRPTACSRSPNVHRGTYDRSEERRAKSEERRKQPGRARSETPYLSALRSPLSPLPTGSRPVSRHCVGAPVHRAALFFARWRDQRATTDSPFDVGRFSTGKGRSL